MAESAKNCWQMLKMLEGRVLDNLFKTISYLPAFSAIFSRKLKMAVTAENGWTTKNQAFSAIFSIFSHFQPFSAIFSSCLVLVVLFRLGCPAKLVSFRYNRNRNRKKFRNYPKQKDLFRFFRKIPKLERFGSFGCFGSTKKEPKEPKGGKREGEGEKGNGLEMEGKGKGELKVRVRVRGRE